MENTFDKPSSCCVGWVSCTLAMLVAQTVPPPPARHSTRSTFVQVLWTCTCDTTQVCQPYCKCIKLHEQWRIWSRNI